MTEPSHAVFLSYASQDAQAAQRICVALRAAGIEVWFDQSALRGGDVWDQTIRKQIKSCGLFIPVISKHTHERDEGYFRLEWKLAVDRSHLMTPNKAFLLPVAIDDTREDDENVPDRFRDVHWTRLPGGETPPAFVERVRGLVSPEPLPARELPTATPSTSRSVPAFARWKRALPVTVAVVVLGALAYLGIDKFSKHPASSLTAPTALAGGAAPSAFAPPPHSIAVLPFVNMSGDKGQEYFSDGLTEEVLNSLAEIEGLQVAGRTSSFYFKNKDVDLGTVAHKLNVAAVLEGSVRRSGNTVRITTQLINALTGFHLWSHTYDRDLGDVLKLEAEIAHAVASALEVSLLENVTRKIELGGTRNPAAFDAYLRAVKAGWRGDEPGFQEAIAAWTEAIRLDPEYAGAFAGRSIAYSTYAGTFANGAAIREFFDKAQSDAQQALTLAPEFVGGHLALADYYENGSLDFAQASEAYDRARSLAPGDAHVLRNSGFFAVEMGHIEPGLTALHRAVVLDPMNPLSHAALMMGLYYSRRYQQAIAAAAEVITLNSNFQWAYGYRGLAEYGLGDLERARATCEAKPDELGRVCLAVIYAKLGRRAGADAQLAQYMARSGDSDAYEYARVYAQWGNVPKALEWLDAANRLRNTDLESLKTDPLMDPLRKEPRFRAIERELKFPQ
jgi:TolB-like protein/Tfp pilus assembly protein PilF